jgi:hypothetical protein
MRGERLDVVEIHRDGVVAIASCMFASRRGVWRRRGLEEPGILGVGTPVEVVELPATAAPPSSNGREAYPPRHGRTGQVQGQSLDV